MNNLTDFEMIKLLGGITVVARMLDIKPPSVHAWLKDGIPESRLVALAAQIELKSGGRFSRKQHWPDKFAIYWPELAQAPVNQAQAATETVAITNDVITQPGALRTDAIRRQVARRAVEATPRRAAEYDAAHADRRAKSGPLFQSIVTGVA